MVLLSTIVLGASRDRDVMQVARPGQLGPPLTPFDAVIESQDRDIEELVRLALAEERAQLAFQPIYLTNETRQLSFYESFVRLLDPSGRTLPAKHFLPEVTDGVLGREIDCCSLRLGLAKLHETPRLRLSINMSARSLGDGKWRDILMRGLRADASVGDRLIFEISEDSAMLLPDIVVRFMEEMQPFGVAFALDNFGLGQTSFSHLPDFLFDLAKISTHFIRDLHKSPDAQVLVESLNAVAHQFEMFTVAEGVEREEEAAMVAHLGIDCMQGYLFGLPKFSL